MEPNKINIVYMGTPGFATGPLKHLIEKGFKVSAVVTAPDKPAGRGLRLVESDVKQYAVSQGIPVLQPISLKSDDFLNELKSYNPHLIIVVAFRMLPKSVWSLPALGTFNLHASILPKYRGAAPINWAIINGETKTGVTTFFIDEQIDTGSIIDSSECIIDPQDNFGTLHDKLMNIGSELVVKTTESIVSGNCRTTLQSSIEATMGDIPQAPKLNKENTRIDWNQSSEQICNLIRGLSPFPAAHTTIVKDGEEPIAVKIYSAKAISGSNVKTAGQIVSDSKRYMRVSTASGEVEIESLQIAGKKRLNIVEFLAGFRNPEEYKFV